MQALGLTATKLRRHMMDTAAARRGDENVSTPDEIVRLLQTLQKMPDAIALLKKPRRIGCGEGCRPMSSRPTSPASSTASASTPASSSRRTGRTSSAVMTTFLKDETEGERAIEDISRAAYEYFSRLGAGALGRRLP